MKDETVALKEIKSLRIICKLIESFVDVKTRIRMIDYVWQRTVADYKEPIITQDMLKGKQ